MYRSGDYLQQQVAATRRSDNSQSLSLQQNFDIATSRKKSNQTELVRLVAATKFFCSHKDFHKNSPVHSERFVAVTCCLMHASICGWNPLVLTFKLNLFGSIFEYYYFCLRMLQNEFDFFKEFFLRPLLEVKGLTLTSFPRPITMAVSHLFKFFFHSRLLSQWSFQLSLFFSSFLSKKNHRYRTQLCRNIIRHYFTANKINLNRRGTLKY